jgi:hypothetical protein
MKPTKSELRWASFINQVDNYASDDKVGGLDAILRLIGNLFYV